MDTRKQWRILLFSFLFYGGIFAQQLQALTPQWRPVYHFTPLKNWTNDPNGLIYLDGVYHMYNQQNPFENKWGHMSWGHATSLDLVHWKHLPIAMPETIDKDTTWRFSGCAVWDKKNTSGFCKKGGCLVAVYTADQPNLKKESQFIAYSNDRGITYTNYVHNPVIDLHMKDFRDPNVSWNEQLQKWLMVVALPSEHKVRFYASGNLKEWDLLSEFGNAGYRQAGWECPSLIELPVNGKPGEHKWVLVVSAAGPKRGTFMQYFVGDFNGKSFNNDSPSDTVLTVDYGDSYYAAIPWNGQPGTEKIMIGWMVPGRQATVPWTGQMSIPRDLSLQQTKNGYRLIQVPASVVETNLDNLSEHKMIKKTGLSIENSEQVLMNLPGNAYWLDAEIIIRSGEQAGFKIAQKKDSQGKSLNETVIAWNAVDRQGYIDKSLSGNSSVNRTSLLKTDFLEREDSVIRIQILFDKSSLEVFFGNGEKSLTTYIYPDADANSISFFAKGSAEIKNLTLWDLSGIK
ncbi:MAG TPA: glycoside hydrolase family 32 protein [Puia sp.]|jgi:levanase/fructan beta-fructosidase